MKNGFNRRFTDHRDLDLIKSFGATSTEGLPRTYLVNTINDIPNQNADGLPFGCTAYSQCELASDQSGEEYDKREFYYSTPPGGFGGRDMRESLKQLTKRGPKKLNGTLVPWDGKYYSIFKQGIFDWFDAIRVGMYVVRNEKRAASIAVAWFPEWCKPVFGSGENTVHVSDDGILPEPPLYVWTFATNHNAVVAGWTDTGIVHGRPLGGTYLAVKSWQGTNVGDGGWVYMSRPIANKLFEMYYTEIFTASQVKPEQFFTIDLPAIDAIISYIRYLLGR